MSEENEEDAEWNSGPFCIHWFGYFECDMICLECKHTCAKHMGGHEACTIGGCDCSTFVTLEE